MNTILSDFRRQAGFGLIELMIAMTLGLILLGSIGYVYIGSRGAFRTTDNLSRMQENARYALEMMARDIRMAGYVGCGNIATMVPKTIANAPVPPLNAENALKGYDNGTGWTNPTTIPRVAGTDVLTVMAAFDGGVNLTGNVAPANANIQVNGNPQGYKQGDVLIISNCGYADVFKVTNSPGSSGTVTLSHSNASNTGNRVGIYGKDAFVMRVDQFTYFVGTPPVTANRPAPPPSLYRVGLAGQAEELVENVQNLQIRYGLDTTVPPDGAIDSYNTAPGNWTQVVSVTLNLLLRSPDNNISTSLQTVTYDNGTTGTFNATDNRLYQGYSTTVGVRNRLPSL